MSKSSLAASTASVSYYYDGLSIAFHWLTVALVCLAYLTIELRGPSGTALRQFWTSVHIGAGLCVLAVTVARLFWRSRRGTPTAQGGPRMVRRLAIVAHAALYAFLLAQPILGVSMLNSAGHPVVIPGSPWSVQVVPVSPLLHAITKQAHELIGNGFYFVIGLHALAALWHHFVVRDNTLRRMLPH
jgi:cytochrome b561